MDEEEMKIKMDDGVVGLLWEAQPCLRDPG